VAQYFPASSVNFIEKYQANKAFAGISDSRMLTIGSRQQWINIDGGPKSFFASYTTSLNNLKSGAGVEINYLGIGAHSRFGYGVSYNYLYNSDYGLISIGIGGGQSFVALDREKILTPDGIYSDGFYDPADNYLNSLYGNSISLSKLNISLLYLVGNFEIGMEFDKAIMIPEKTGIAGRDLLKLNFQYQYYINENISLRMNALLYSDFVVAQSDIGIVALINRNYIGGLNFRAFGKNSIESLSLIAGTNISRNLILVYAYDVVLNRVSETGSSSHELRLFINLGKQDKRRKIPPLIYNPRL
jgi:type IX secretion system PorP/SprF family membrane protein